MKLAANAGARQLMRRAQRGEQQAGQVVHLRPLAQRLAPGLNQLRRHMGQGGDGLRFSRFDVYCKLLQCIEIGVYCKVLQCG